VNTLIKTIKVFIVCATLFYILKSYDVIMYQKFMIESLKTGDPWYIEQIEKWVAPELKLQHKQKNHTLKEKPARG